MNLPEREASLRKNIVRLAEESFPDDLGLTWTIKSFEHTGALTKVEVERQADEYGAPHFLFVCSFARADSPSIVACYERSGGTWELLFDDGSKP